MQPKRLALTATTTMAFLGGCNADPISPINGSAAEQAQAAASVGSPALTTRAVSTNEIDLSWQDNSRNENGWEVHRSTTGATGAFTLLATLATGATFYANTGLTQQTEYCYKVRSFKTAGPNTIYGSFFNPSCSTTPAAPEAPSNVSAIPGTWYGAVTVTWSDNSSSETGFRVERSESTGGPFAVIATLSANATSYLENIGILERQVCYRVVAFNANGPSGPSNVDCTALPNPVSDLAARSVDAQSIDLTWSDNSAVEDGYEVRRADASYVFVAVARVPANATTYHDASVTPDVRYWYQVFAMRDGGFSYGANTATAISISRPPTAPTNLQATPSGSTSIALSWSNSSSNTEGVRIERSLNGGSSWTTAELGGPDQNYFYDFGRSSEQQVCYRLFAVNRLGDSPASNTDCTTPPAAATNFSVTSNADGSADLRWKDNSGVEDAYMVLAAYYDWDGNYSVFYVATLPSNSESYRLDDASLYWGYDLTVVAVKDGGFSDWAVGVGASQAAALRASPRKPRMALKSGGLTKPFDARLPSLKKLAR